MTTTLTAPKFRYLGVTDECVECQQCGKVGLRSTVVLDILDADGNGGEVTYYGSTCAARALGVTGRGASAKVLGLARAAHRELVLNAYDARRKLAAYGLPETGHPDFDTLDGATLHYADNHYNAMWANGLTYREWRTRVLDMLARYQAALADAARIGATVPTNDRELSRFVNTF